ncbi:site-specific integrase [Tunicatimonas pelagia]|uniref:site-specific integrase n=1 Tax=Tunicatimonas pelagia TaxID=931531 RepID=UPI002665B5B5|nr:site-specific integrase [Tunicatimonas pelagia]WKN46509.1 site-specific integrase [Tunicatimonas pelagia]
MSSTGKNNVPDIPVRISKPSPAVTATAARFLRIGIEKSGNTVRAYQGDLNCYTRWCENQRVPPFPATADQVVNYISDLADRYKVATLQRRLAMLSSFHELQGMESPTSSKLVRTAMDGIKRSLGIKQHQAPAFTLETFQKVLLSLDESVNSQLRDKVVLLLGFTGAFRRGELVALNVDDLNFDEEGILIDVRRSKTDQLAAGQLKAIFYASHPGLCPVRTTKRYLQRITECGAMPDEPGASPLLLRMRRGDRFGLQRLTDQTVNLIVAKHFGNHFSAHTLRASFVTVSKKNGASNSEIMAQTHHKTEAMIRRYTRFEDARSHNAGTKLGL